MILPPYLKPAYWFTTQAAAFTGGQQKWIFGMCAAAVIAGMVVRFVSGQKKKQDKLMAHALRRVSDALLTLGAIGLFLFFSSYERVQLFGSPLLFLALLIGTILWAVFLVRYFLYELPARRIQQAHREIPDKYLPHTH